MNRELVGRWLNRILSDGVFYPDALDVISTVDGWDDWFEKWADTARTYEALASQAEEEGYRVTASEYHLQAALAWQYATFLRFDSPNDRYHAERQRVSNFDLAIRDIRPSVARHEIAFEGTHIPGYLRLPVDVERPRCVLLIGGVDSTKEDTIELSNLFLDRGLATFAFDGPGQGEYFDQQPMVPDFERYTSAVIDYLSEREDIATDNFGAIGRSIGGYYALRSALTDERLGAVVVWGGTYDLSHFDTMEEVAQAGFLFASGIEDHIDARRTVMQYLDLAPLQDLLRQFRGRVLIYHGAHDQNFPVAQAQRLADSMPDHSRVLEIDPEERHCCHMRFPRTRRLMVDWLTGELGKA
ncbi:MAG: prolyl oligopeptidase family serine peptidase [Acidimicrobiia bacterium]